MSFMCIWSRCASVVLGLGADSDAAAIDQNATDYSKELKSLKEMRPDIAKQSDLHNDLELL